MDKFSNVEQQKPLLNACFSIIPLLMLQSLVQGCRSFYAIKKNVIGQKIYTTNESSDYIYIALMVDITIHYQ